MARNDILARLAVLITADSAQLKRDTASAAKSMESFSKTATGALNQIKLAAATIGLGAIGREVIDVTAQFQKFEAVLENTLGSQSAAQIAIRDIEKFASQTPFAVDELTASFVKLANQGFQPSTEELRKLGDLASSTGKGFDQLTEAIIDAQVGEFERLKEFGIRAKKEGDNVKFTFKGVETQTKFTSEAIREYVLSLGDAEGVSGSMAKISETLGGQISNLGDSWTTFLKTIGDGNAGPLSGVVTLLSQALKIATELIKTNRQVQEEAQTEGQSQILKDLKELEQITGDVEGASSKLIARLNEQKEAIVDQAAPLFADFEANEKTIEVLNNKAKVIDAQIQAINDYTAATIKNTQAEVAANAAKTASKGLILNLEAQLKTLEDQKKKSFSTVEIAQFNQKISELRDELEVLNASKPLSKFAQDQLDAATQNLEFKAPEFSPTEGVTNLFPTTIPVPDINPAMAALAVYTQAHKDAGVSAIQSYDQMRQAQELQIQKQQEATNAALDYGSAIGESLGQAITGQKSFANAMKQLTADLLKTFLARALGGIIASAATSGGPPPVAIALAAAGVAAISAMFSKIGGPSKSVGGGAGAPTGETAQRFLPVSSQAQMVQFDATFRVEGDALEAVANNTNHRSSRTG